MDNPHLSKSKLDRSLEEQDIEYIYKSKTIYHNQDSADKMSPRRYPKSKNSPFNV